MLEISFIEKIREKFPVTRNLIYFDHAAVAPIHTDSVKAVHEYLQDLLNYGDRNYKNWFEKSETIRQGMAEFIGADPDEIAFIKNTSHGLSLVANGLNFNSGDSVVIPEIEFPANVYPWLSLEKKGVKVKFVKTENGQVPLENIEETIDKTTRLVSVSSTEFSSGYRNDLKAISQICKRKSEEFSRKIYFCVDAIQSLGSMKIDVRDCDVDFLSADGHKWFLTPEGAGIFYCNKENLEHLYPAIIGWRSVENPLDFSNIHFDLQKTARKFEEGSLNMMGVIALGASLELFNFVGIDEVEKKILNLTKLALEAFQQKDYFVFGSLADCHRSGIISFKTHGSIEDDFKYFLNNKVQLSMRGGFLRISPHFYNTDEEIARFVSMLR